MARRKPRVRWVKVYQSEVPGHARLIATLLGSQGMAAKSARSRRKTSSPRLALVSVAPHDAEQARGLLAERRIGAVGG